MKLFMHHFEKMSASGGFAPRLPLGFCPLTPLGDYIGPAECRPLFAYPGKNHPGAHRGGGTINVGVGFN